MEYERQIYKIHERMMTGDKFRMILKIVGSTLITVGLLGPLLVFIAHSFYSKGTGLITQAIREYEQNLTKHGVYTPADYNFDYLKFKGFSGTNITRRLEDVKTIDPKIGGELGKVDLEKFAQHVKKFNLTEEELYGYVDQGVVEKMNKGLFMKLYQHRHSVFQSMDILNIRFISMFNKSVPSNMSYIVPYEAIDNKTELKSSYSLSDSSYMVKIYLTHRTNLPIVHNIFIDYDLYVSKLPFLARILKKEPFYILDMIHAFR